MERGTHYRYRVPCQQVLLVESGRMWAVAEGRRWWAEPGTLLCLRKQALNEYGWEGAVRYWEAHFTGPGGAAPTIEGQPLPARIPHGDAVAEAEGAFAQWSRELPQAGDVARFRVRAAVWSFFAAVAAALDRAPAQPRADRWEVVRARLEANLGRPLALGALARASGVSPDHLIRGFRRRFGMAPMAWRRRAELRRAVELLKAGEAVKTVAGRMGFDDASAFTRAFRRQFGLSPTAYMEHGPGSVPVEPGLVLNRHLRPAGLSGDFTWS
jgi:AraC-like DNA-binding protein